MVGFLWGFQGFCFLFTKGLQGWDSWGGFVFFVGELLFFVGLGLY